MPAWQLDADLCQLTDPPGPCRVIVRVDGLVFDSYVDVSKMRYEIGSEKYIRFQDALAIQTNGDVKKLENLMHAIVDLLHCSYSPDTAKRIWFELTNSRTGKNMFALKTPFLIRLAPSGFDSSRIHESSLIKCDRKCLLSCGVPSERDLDTHVGLYSSYIVMVFSSDESGIPRHKQELWPDISQDLCQLLSPPQKIYVSILFTEINFVSFTSKDEIRSMWYKPTPRVKMADSVQRWWAGVHSYMQELLNAPSID